jgi:thymidylate synthase (FAD)
MALKASKKMIVTEPNVFVIGYQRIHKNGLARFLRSEGHKGWETTATSPNEIIPEVAGRLCYMSFSGGRAHDEYVENLKRDRHGSVLEHSVVSFILTGVSRAFTHECVRHRAGWSYSQLSQRYVDESHAQYVAPWAIARKPRILAKWKRMVESSHSNYEKIKRELELEYGETAIPETSGKPYMVKLSTVLKKLVCGAARSLLPNATETKIFCTVNARALRHFLEMRASQQADHEIRLVAMSIYYAVLSLMPDILSDYRVLSDEDGVEYLQTVFVKV